MSGKNVFGFLLIAVVLVSACVSQPAARQQNASQLTEQQPAPSEQPEQQQPASEQQPAQQEGQLGGATVPSVKEFKVVISHTFYTPNRFEVSKGDTVRLLANAAKGTGDEGGFSHNHGITIDEYGINAAVTREDAGNPHVIEFAADRAGEFRIYCKTCWDGPFGTSHPAIQAALVVKG